MPRRGSIVPRRTRAGITSMGTPRGVFNPRTMRTLASAASKLVGYAAKKYDSYRKRTKPLRKSALRDTDRINQDLGTGGELTKAHVTIGRVPRAVPVKRLVKASRQQQVFRWSAISPFMNTTTIPVNPCATGAVVGAGANWLANWLNSTPGAISLPLHIYDLTSINNIINGSLNTATPAYYPFQTASTGAITWVPLVANKNDMSGTTQAWTAEDTSGLPTSYAVSPLRQTLMDWVQARFMCYGSAKMATEYIIEIIQLKSDYLCPDIMGGTLPSSAGLNYKNAANQFWNAYVKSSVAHPVATVNPTSRQHYKVIKTIRFTLQPRLTNESDAPVGHCKLLNIFFRANRTCKYDWAEDTIDPNIESGGAYPTEQGQLQLTVHPRARMYMTVRATNVTQVVSPAIPTYDYTPSYDLLLRKKITTLQ